MPRCKNVISTEERSLKISFLFIYLIMKKHYYVEKSGRIISDYESIEAAIRHAQAINGTILVQYREPIDCEQ